MDKKYRELMRERPELFANLSGGIEILTDPTLIEQMEREQGVTVGIVYEDEYLTLIKDAVRFADGVVGPYIRAYHKSSGGVSIAVLCGDKMLLLRHFRHSLRRWMWETPRGFGEAGQTTEQNAFRELYEELGVKPLTLTRLGVLTPDAGIIGEDVTLYLASIDADSPLVTEVHEGIERVALFTKEQIKAAILSGEITDGITVASLTYAELLGLI